MKRAFATSNLEKKYYYVAREQSNRDRHRNSQQYNIIV